MAAPGPCDVPDVLLHLHDEAGFLAALYDAEDRLRYANAAFQAAFHLGSHEGPSWAEIMRRNFEAGRGTVIRNPDFEAWLHSTSARRGKVGFRAFETDLHDGRWLWMTETVQSSGWMLCIASDITPLQADHRAVRQDRDFAIRASFTDELTGLPNRRFVWARLEEMLAQDRAFGGCTAVIDLDRFKPINDRYGHHVGDLILKDFAARALAHVRRTDTIGRLGGEEFLLVLPDARPADAMAIVERMLTGVRAAQPVAALADLRYSFSAGIASMRPDDTANDLYARADRALYRAKSEGRNCIRMNDLEGAGQD
jgi:diguanylate cyclase (GGDEF)-like protein